MFVLLNLATKPLLSHRRFLAGSTVIAVFGLLLFLLLGIRFYGLRKADADLRSRTGKVEAQTVQLLQQRHELDDYFSQQESAGLQDRAKFIKNVIEARSFNWTQ